jgi:virginiamycin B lyase
MRRRRFARGLNSNIPTPNFSLFTGYDQSTRRRRVQAQKPRKSGDRPKTGAIWLVPFNRPFKVVGRPARGHDANPHRATTRANGCQPTNEYLVKRLVAILTRRPPGAPFCAGLVLCLLALAGGRVEAISLTYYGIPIPPGSPSGITTTFPLGITEGPDHALWFAEPMANFIEAMDTNGNIIVSVPCPAGGAYPYRVVTGPDTNMWFSESLDSRILVVSPTNGTIVAEFSIPNQSAEPAGITVGPDNQIWFIEKYACRVARLTASVSNIVNGVPNIWQEFPEPDLSSTSYPQEIITGPDTNLWFTATAAGALGAINTNGTLIATINLPNPGCSPWDLTTTTDGSIWFTEYNGNAIGRLTGVVAGGTNITLTEYAIPTPNCHPIGIAPGLSNSVWFAEYGGSKIGYLTVTNNVPVFYETFTASGSSPAFLTKARDGSIWFTDPNLNSIGHLTDSPLVANPGSNFTATVGIPTGSLVVATFQDTDPVNSSVADYTATVNWGDGAMSVATINTNANAGLPNAFTVTASHTYTSPAALDLSTVTITDTDNSHDPGGATVTVNNTVNVLAGNAAPSLGILAQPGLQVLIYWPTNGATTTNGASLFQLQSELLPTAASWVNVTNVPAITNVGNPPETVFGVTVGAITQAFYRLEH